MQHPQGPKSEESDETEDADGTGDLTKEEMHWGRPEGTVPTHAKLQRKGLQLLREDRKVPAPD